MGEAVVAQSTGLYTSMDSRAETRCSTMAVTASCTVLEAMEAGSQDTSLAFADTLALESIAASTGSVGNAYDNALAKSTIGLFKTKAVSKWSPFLTGPTKTIDDVEFAAMGWIDWFNQNRLHSTLDYLTPDEFEEVYYNQELALHPEILQA
ncbi:integrase core domain-containing protein [Rhodococcus sp. BS-15]|uniref:integrase core domain-containing protein n=1 Tax=Rhodococcus sp. BS-15 TaxID=1304954 RepID=UPI000FFBE218|nr:integrase core domain-containing protein [Rhodococcus sp. BS-15]